MSYPKTLRWIAALVLFATITTPAFARGHHHHYRYHYVVAAPFPETDPVWDFIHGVRRDASIAYKDTAYRVHTVYHSRYLRPVRTSIAVVSRWPAMAERGASNVAAMIRNQVSQSIGSQWVGTALQIAKIESRGRCNARNPSGASGVFQVMHPEQFGVSRGAALTCSGGIRAGVAHMARCIRAGARTHGQMLACHNSGSPFTRHGHLERAYRVALR